MKAKAPGKLILSGEHSVVYGAPAIAVAVDQSVTTSFFPDDTDNLMITSEGLGSFQLPISELPSLTDRLDKRFQSFLVGQIGVSRLLDSSSDLLFYTLAHTGFTRGGQIDIRSDIPAGAGMGSSAAVIAALLKLAGGSEFTDLEKLFASVSYCERLQHGRGSAIDAAAVSYGGVVKVTGNQIDSLSVNLDQNWYIWNSGAPVSTTGETVSEVRKQYATSDIWKKFSTVTDSLEKALEEGEPSRLLETVRSNEQLLEDIGVVPHKVAATIRGIEQLGGAAKVCGAGSVKGDNGGLALVYLPELNAGEVSHALQICLEPLKTSYQGACLEKD